ncbi:sialidase family protein [uncultured Abyssibacter sp.]|uniref:sialidase family protein n=1 Tax=uncultured Abyssibacter sp. TaxID=2320202 RepID=UPI0032B12A80
MDFLRVVQRSPVILRLGALVPVIFLSACATVPSAGLGDVNAEIPDDAGLVAIQVVSNATRLSNTISQWDEVVVLRLSDGELLTIPSTGSGFVSTRAFVGALAPGEYAIAGLYAVRRLSNSTHTMTARVPPIVGRFNVEAHRFTNLGTLVFQPFEEATQQNQSVSYLVSRIPSSAELMDLVRMQFPSEYADLLSAEAIGWSEDDLGPLREKVSGRVRKFALATMVEPESDGSFWMLGRLGQAYRRDSSGAWSRISIDTPYQLTTAARLADGSVIVGGERGALFRSHDGQEIWDVLSFPLRDANITELGQFDTGDLFALAEVSDAFVLMRSASGENWSQVASFAKQKPGWLAEVYRFYTVSFPYVVQKGDRLDIWMDKQLIGYDAMTGEITRKPAIEFSRLVVQGNGILVGREYSSWSGEKNPQYSVDGGKTWKEVEIGEGTFSTANGMPFVFGDGRLLKTGASSKFKLSTGWTELDAVSVLVSSDAGKSWSTIGSVPKRCGRLSHESSTDEFLLAVCRDGRILGSRDGGRQWAHEFGEAPTTEDFPEFFPDESSTD